MGEEKKEEDEEEDLSLAYAARGQGNTPDPVKFFLHFLKYFNISFLAFFLSPYDFKVLPDIQWWATSIR